MTEQSLTLRQIENNLRELIQYREDLLVNSFEMEESERAETLRLTEEQITLSVKRELKKADGIAFHLLEFKRHIGKCSDRNWKQPGTIDLEIERLKNLKETYLARYEYLEEVTIQALQFVEQMEGRKSIEGELSTLALRKNNPAVEIAQEALLPKEYCNLTIKLPESIWQEVIDSIENDGLKYRLEMAVIGATSEPMKQEIARVLKSTEPCPKCNGKGMLNPGDSIPPEPCDQCGGSGKVSCGVAGCRLVSGVRLEVR